MRFRYRELILFVSLVGFLLTAYASNNPFYKAFLEADRKMWKYHLDSLSKSPADMETLLSAYYGYIGWCIEEDLKKEGEEYLDQAYDLMDELEDDRSNSATMNAYKAAFYGYDIELNPYKAAFIGPKSMKKAVLALEQDTLNWFAHEQYGHVYYYMPSMFGRDRALAIKHYERALDLLEADLSGTEKNWNELNLLLVLAQAYGEQENKIKSKEYYEKLKTKAPNFKKIKSVSHE